MVENSFRGQFYHFEKHVEPISVHFCHFGVEIFPECCTKGTRGKTQITQKNVAHWGQCCTLGGCTLGATSVVQIMTTNYYQRPLVMPNQPQHPRCISARLISAA